MCMKISGRVLQEDTTQTKGGATRLGSFEEAPVYISQQMRMEPWRVCRLLVYVACLLTRGGPFSFANMAGPSFS